jgi:hypothetical protein
MDVQNPEFYAVVRSEEKKHRKRRYSRKLFFSKNPKSHKKDFLGLAFSIHFFCNPLRSESALNSGFLTPILTYFVKTKICAEKEFLFCDAII